MNFQVTGMSCAACAAAVERAVSGLAGVEKAPVNLLTNSMTVFYSEELYTDETQLADAVGAAVKKAGYGASPKTAFTGRQTGRVASAGNGQAHETRASQTAGPQNAQSALKRQFLTSLVLLIPLMYIAMHSMLPFPVPRFITSLFDDRPLVSMLSQLILLIPVLIINRKYFTSGFGAMLHGNPTMNSLVATGCTASVLYSLATLFMTAQAALTGQSAPSGMHVYFDSSAMILTIITLGKWLEARGKAKTSRAVEELIKLAPDTAIIETADGEKEVSSDQVLPGTIVIARPGSRISVDGIVVSGSSSIDESAITGESIPVFKKEGDAVTAATMNGSGSLRIRTTAAGKDTSFAKIIALVEEAAAGKAHIARAADTAARYFVPAVLIIALITFIAWFASGATVAFALTSAVSVLVISCPCALGLATPVAIMAGTGQGAKNGILFKDGAVLETLSHIDTVVLDKTGTITEGKPVVTDVLFTGGNDSFLSAARTLEHESGHPLAAAVTGYADKILAERGAQSAPSFTITDFISIPGSGVTALLSCDGSPSTEAARWFAGNEAYITSQGVTLSEEVRTSLDALKKAGKTPLLFARAPLSESGKAILAGVIAVADTVRSESPAAITRMKNMGLSVIMLTGDNEVTAQSVAAESGISEVIAGVKPDQKEAAVRALQEKGRKVAMIGDGINDAPALTRAEAGIAIGAGTDVAIESADIILVRNSLSDAAAAFALGRKVIRIIKQNLFWALCYNAACIPLAAGVFYKALGWQLNPMIGSAAMGLSSICVVTNALRLTKMKLRGNDVAEKTETAFQAAGPQEAESAYEAPAAFQADGAESEYAHKENDMRDVEIVIEGMMCTHCSGRVEAALNAIAGVEAKVDLAKNTAFVKADAAVSDEVLSKAVTDAGYTVVSVK